MQTGQKYSVIVIFSLALAALCCEALRSYENISRSFKFERSGKAISNWIPKIKISLKKQGKDLELKLKDNGIGISSKDIDRIFFDFYTTKSPGEGMGLGLYIAKESIQKFNGSISALSIEGEYTEFTILLPIDRLTDILASLHS